MSINYPFAKNFETISISGPSRPVLGDFIVNNTILGGDDNDPDVVKQQNLYKFLANFDLNARRNQLAQTRKKYLEWVWEEGEAGPGLTEWLTHEGTIFWVSGKPASGKSTFMQYLSEHRSCTRMLAQATDRDWLVIRFYFDFRARKTTANSIEGLLRSMLAQLVAKSRAIARYISTSTFAQFPSHESHGIGEDVLQEAIVSAIVTTNSSVCMFIDGLDEFEESYHELANLIKDISSVEHVKICVASRPEQAFELAFQGLPSIRMQDHNSASIEAYTKECLSTFAGYLRPMAALAKLMEDISKDSQGVFLWVHLVCRDLVEGLLARETVLELRARLACYPRDLDKVYDRMLSRLDSRILPEAALILYLIDASSQTQTGKHLYATLRWLSHRDILASFPTQLLYAEDFEKRVQARLGGLVDIFMDTNSIDDGLLADEMSIWATKDYITRLVHKTLASYLQSSQFFAHNLPQGFKSSYPDHAWIRLCCDMLINNKIFSLLSQEDFEDITLLSADTGYEAWETSTRVRLGLTREDLCLQVDEIRQAVRAVSQELDPELDGFSEISSLVGNAAKSQAFCWQVIRYSDYDKNIAPLFRSLGNAVNLLRLPVAQRGLFLCLKSRDDQLASILLRDCGPAGYNARLCCREIDLADYTQRIVIKDEVPGFMEWLTQAPPIPDNTVDNDDKSWWNWCYCFSKSWLAEGPHHVPFGAECPMAMGHVRAVVRIADD